MTTSDFGENEHQSTEKSQNSQQKVVNVKILLSMESEMMRDHITKSLCRLRELKFYHNIIWDLNYTSYIYNISD